MEADVKSISTKQYAVIVFLTEAASKLFSVPFIMLQTGGRSTILALILYFVIDALILGAVFLVSKLCGDETFFSLLERTLGKIAAKIIAGIIICGFVLKIITYISIIKNYLALNMFDTMIWPIFIIPILIILYSIARGTLNGLSRLSLIMFPFLMISLILLMLFIFNNVSYERLLPIGVDANETLLPAAVSFPMWFGDGVILFLYQGRVKKSKHHTLTVWLAFGITALLIIFCSVSIYSSYIDVVQLLDYGRKISSVIRISVSRISTGRIDIIIICIWMIGVILVAGHFTFCASRAAELIVFKKKRSKLSVIAVILIVFALNAFFFDHEGRFYDMLTNCFNFVIYAFYALLVLVSVIAAVIYRTKKLTGGKTSDEEA